MQFDAELVFRPSYEGDRAGLVLMGLDYFTLEFVKQSGIAAKATPETEF